MSITTYSELKTAVASWLDRDDLSDHAGTFIQLAEDRHKNEVRIREMQRRETLTLSEGSDSDTDRYLAVSGLSSTFLDLKYLRLKVPDTTSGPVFYPPMKEVTPDEMTAEWAIKDGRRPLAFTVWAEEIEFDSMADQDYTVELLFYTELEPLSDVNPSNALLARSSGMYLFSSLAEAAPFLMDDPRIPVWEGKYTALRDALNEKERDYNRGGPQVSRVRGLPPKRR